MKLRLVKKFCDFEVQKRFFFIWSYHPYYTKYLLNNIRFIVEGSNPFLISNDDMVKAFNKMKESSGVIA